MRLLKLLLLILLGSAAAVRADLPPRQPRPEALAAARLLVADLPIEEFSFFSTTQRVAGELADQWQRYDGGVPEGVEPPVVREILARRLAIETTRALPAVLADVEERYATAVALQFSIEELAALRAFYAGPHGRRFALDRVIDSSQLQELVAEAVRGVVGPRVAALAAESVESARLLGSLNRPRR